MIVRLYNCNLDGNVVGKISYAQSGVEVQGTFRGPVTVSAPTLKLARTATIDIDTFNYVYIPDLKRYYYVTSKIINNFGVITVELQEDVLETYNNSIRLLEAFVERSQQNYDASIPDTMAILLPQITNTYHGMTRADSGVTWETPESLWTLSNQENTKLCYIVKFGYASFSSRKGTTPGDRVVLPYSGPLPMLICTKKFLRLLMLKANAFGTSIFDKWTSFKDAILSIETIPDGFMWNDPEYRSIAAGTATLENSEVVTHIDINGFDMFFELDGLPDVAYAFVLSPNHFVRQLTWKWDCNVSTNWKNSGDNKVYTVKFAPFGTFNIPADELLGESTFYIHVKHSLITGLATIGYYTESIQTKKPLSENTINFQVPFVKIGDAADFIWSTAKATTAALFTAAPYIGAKLQSVETNAIIKARAREEYIDKVKDAYEKAGRPAGGWEGAVNAVSGSTEAFRYEHPEKFRAASTDTSVLANTFAAQGFNNYVDSVTRSIPKVEISGSLKGVLTDIAPSVIVSSRTFITPPIYICGRPCYKKFVLGQFSGYMLISNFRFTDFRKGNDPVPTAEEYGMLNKALTSGIYIN